MRTGSQEARPSGGLMRLIQGRTVPPQDRGSLQGRKVGAKVTEAGSPLRLLSRESESAGTMSCRVSVTMNLKGGHEGSAT